MLSKKKIPTLIIEHVSDVGNLHLLSLLAHKRINYLVIVDSVSEDTLTAYVLDYAQQEGIDLAKFIDISSNWLEKTDGAYPLSFELSRLGLTGVTKKIYKSFDLSYVTRLVGRSFSHNLVTPLKIRRRRACKVPAGIEIRPKALVQFLKK